MLIGLTSYVPTYVQVVLGTGPLVAGFALATLTIGWPLAASYAGRLYLRIGFRLTALLGGVVALGGAALTLTFGRASPVWHVGLVCFVIGIGLGLVARPDPDRRAVQRRLVGPGGGHRQQPVQPLDRQRRRRGTVRRDRQHRAAGEWPHRRVRLPRSPTPPIWVFSTVVVLAGAMVAAALLLPRRRDQVVVWMPAVTTILLRGGRVHTAVDPDATAVGDHRRGDQLDRLRACRAAGRPSRPHR